MNGGFPICATWNDSTLTAGSVKKALASEVDMSQFSTKPALVIKPPTEYTHVHPRNLKKTLKMTLKLFFLYLEYKIMISKTQPSATFKYCALPINVLLRTK